MATGFNFIRISKFFLYLAPFAVIVVTPSTLFPFIVGKYTFFKAVVELALIAFILGWGFSGKFFTKGARLPDGQGSASGGQFSVFNFQSWKQPLVIAVALFVAVFVFAGFFGVNPQASFWSNFERGEGSFLMLHFLVFFALLCLLFVREEDWRNLFKVSVAAGVLAMLYGAAAAFGISGFVGNSICQRFAGSLGNPAYIGTFSIFMLFYTAYLSASGNWQSKTWRTRALPFLIFLIVYFSLFLLLSQTRGGFLGLGAGIVAALFYLAFALASPRARSWALGGVVVFIFLGSLGVYYRQYINLAPWCEGGGNRILDVSFGGETINTRFELWRQSVEAWKERPILGWGPENFSMAFEKHFKPVHTVWFDRAHNIFFDYLVMTGAFGLLSFIGIFVAYYWQFFRQARINADQNAKLRGKNNEKLPTTNYQLPIINALFFALPIAYLVQGLVLFDVLPIYINLFLVLAFANYKLR